MSDSTPQKPSFWSRFGVPLIVLAIGFLNGWGYHPHGEDWGYALVTMFFMPGVLVFAALGAAFAHGNRFGRFCVMVVLFVIASYAGMFISSIH